jgi:hypothetical protein
MLVDTLRPTGVRHEAAQGQNPGIGEAIPGGAAPMPHADKVPASMASRRFGNVSRTIMNGVRVVRPGEIKIGRHRRQSETGAPDQHPNSKHNRARLEWMREVSASEVPTGLHQGPQGQEGPRPIIQTPEESIEAIRFGDRLRERADAEAEHPLYPGGAHRGEPTDVVPKEHERLFDPVLAARDANVIADMEAELRLDPAHAAESTGGDRQPLPRRTGYEPSPDVTVRHFAELTIEGSAALARVVTVLEFGDASLAAGGVTTELPQGGEAPEIFAPLPRPDEPNEKLTGRQSQLANPRTREAPTQPAETVNPRRRFSRAIALYESARDAFKHKGGSHAAPRKNS